LAEDEKFSPIKYFPVMLNACQHGFYSENKANIAYVMIIFRGKIH